MTRVTSLSRTKATMEQRQQQLLYNSVLPEARTFTGRKQRSRRRDALVCQLSISLASGMTDTVSQCIVYSSMTFNASVYAATSRCVTLRDHDADPARIRRDRCIGLRHTPMPFLSVDPLLFLLLLRRVSVLLQFTAGRPGPLLYPPSIMSAVVLLRGPCLAINA